MRFYPIVIGIWIAADVTSITDSTEAFFDMLLPDWNLDLPVVDGPTLLFWILLGSWVVLASKVVDRENQNSRESIERQEELIVNQSELLLRLTGTLYGVRQPYILSNFPEMFRLVQYQMAQFKRVDISLLDTNKLQEYKSHVRGTIEPIMSTILDMTGYISDATSDCLGVNVMVFLESEDSGIKEYVHLKKNYYLHNWDLGRVKGHLYLNPEISLSSRPNNEENEEYETVVLPVPHEYKSSSGARQALPGAPSAVFTDREVIHNIDELKSVMKECFDEDANITFDQYFIGEKSKIKSFYSKKIGVDDNLIGVLNVDSSRGDIIGASSESKDKFFDLIGIVVDQCQDVFSALCDITKVDLKEEYDNIAKDN